MNKTKKKRKKTFVLSAAIASMLLPPLTMNAQYDEHKYGLQPWFKSSLMRREGSTVGGYNLTNQQFGSDANGGYNLFNQTFGQENEGSLGSGFAIFMVAGAGYAVMKSRKKTKNEQVNKERKLQ